MFGPLYLAFALPGMILAIIATLLTRFTFAKYSKVGASSGLSGAEAARQMLDSQGIHDVKIEMTQGFLSDHYDPRDNTLRLSPAVYQGQSLSSIGVACHEAGHALQKAHKYAPLHIRSALVPATQFGSQLAMPLLMLGMVLHFPVLLKLGILLFSAAVIFSIVTLPVEWNATARAKRLMVSSGVVSRAELPQAGAVLNAAFLTYVAAAVTAVLQLLYYLLIANRRNN